MTSLFECPVLVSIAETVSNPLTSTSKVISILGSPRGALGISSNLKVPSK